jgi:hypothetical protein
MYVLLECRSLSSERAIEGVSREKVVRWLLNGTSNPRYDALIVSRPPRYLETRSPSVDNSLMRKKWVYSLMSFSKADCMIAICGKLVSRRWVEVAATTLCPAFDDLKMMKAVRPLL